jgi:AcrR family transcriptional regulator
LRELEIRGAPSRSPGRPRDDAAAPALLEAARRLVNRDGYEAVSIAEIAAEAGVARQTLYRRWPSKADLVLETFLFNAGPPPSDLDGPLQVVLERFLCTVFQYLEHDGRAIRSLIASAQSDAQFLQSLRQRFILPREQIVRDLLVQAVASGEVSAEADLALAVDVFHGTFWYHLLMSNPLNGELAARLAHFIVAALGAVRTVPARALTVS